MHSLQLESHLRPPGEGALHPTVHHTSFTLHLTFQGLGFRVQGSRVQGSGFRVQGSSCRVQGSGLRVQGSGFRVQRSTVHNLQLESNLRCAWGRRLGGCFNAVEPRCGERFEHPRPRFHLIFELFVFFFILTCIYLLRLVFILVHFAVVCEIYDVGLGD